jgi:ubiquinone/menaquinone biosynthesis C-methylase UbiE
MVTNSREPVVDAAFDYEAYQSHLDLVRTYGPTARFMDRMIRKVGGPLRGLRILDLGCGTGHISLMMERDNRVVSYDPALEGVRLTRRRRRTAGGFVVGGGEALPFRDASFDAVLLIDVLEHIPDDVTVAREACRVLRPGGLVLCMVPENPALYSRIDAANGHVRRYRADELRRLFAPCRADTFFDYGFPFMRLYLRLLAPAHDAVVPRSPPKGLGRLAMAAFSRALSALFSLDLLFAGSLRGVELVALFRKPPSAA